MGSITPSHNDFESTSKSGHLDLQDALNEAKTTYYQRNALSKSHHEEACNYMPGGNTRTVLHTTPFPMTIKSAQSCYLTSLDGQTYIDFLGEYTAGIYGHSHPIIRKAIEEALSNGWNYGGHTLMEAELARVVCERFRPSGMEMIRFVNSGTEANMMAIATALAFTGKKQVLLFENGYHGSTISGRSISDDHGLSINLPHQFLVGRYNDVNGTEELVGESCSVDGTGDKGLAAILVEPMMGSGGCYVGSSEFLVSLRQLATKYGALLIFDEVMTSRLSYHGFSSTFARANDNANDSPKEMSIRPDLMTLGKWVGGGMSFGAFGGREEIMSLFDPRRMASSPPQPAVAHPGTFNNNVFSMSAGLAGCELLTEKTLEKLNGLGDRMRGEIESVLEAYQIYSKIKGHTLPVAPFVGAHAAASYPKMFVKGVGSLMCIHFTGPEKDTLQTLFFHHMLDQGIYMAQRGFMALSIEIQEEHVRKYIKAVDEFCVKWKTVLQS